MNVTRLKRVCALFSVALISGALSCGGEPYRELSIAAVLTAPALSSVEVGRTPWGPDHAGRPDVPAGGTLFSVWMKIPDPGSTYPWSHGDMDAYVLSGANWHIRCLGGNSGATSPTSARYNANCMIFADPQGTWAGDYAYYESDYTLTDAVARGWVWVAWQIVVSNNTFTLRQWVKLGPTGQVFAAGQSSPTLAQLRAALIQNGMASKTANAWTPKDATSFQVGSDNGYLFHARMQALATSPALAQLEAIADTNAPDTTAWGDYLFDWENGAANLEDQSGHARNLQLAAGGVLYQGPTAPVGGGTAAGAGGSAGAGAAGSSGGTGGAGAGGAGGAIGAGGSMGAGGVTSAGGSVGTGTGGVVATGGTAAGGSIGSGGTTSMGGSVGTGGAAASAGAGGGSPSGYSIEVGRTAWGPDHAGRPDVPAGGTLFSVWTKIPDPGSTYPWSRGNMDVYLLNGANWQMVALAGNSSANSATSARYNANTMIFAEPQGTWAGDFSYYESDFTLTDPVVRGWVWTAWQVVVSNGTFTLQQWLKLGVNGTVFAAGTSAPTLAQLRANLISNGMSSSAANAWTPADATSFQVGSDDGYLFHARMQATAATPTLAQLQAIANSTAPDSTAWGDYLFDWENGAPNLTDQSGHGHNLQLAAGGVLHQGPVAP